MADEDKKALGIFYVLSLFDSIFAARDFVKWLSRRFTQSANMLANTTGTNKNEALPGPSTLPGFPTIGPSGFSKPEKASGKGQQ